MPANLGIYPLQDPIADGNGNLTPSWEKVLRGIFTNTQGAVKPVGLFTGSGNAVIVPGNTLRNGSNIEIVAGYSGIADTNTVSVFMGAQNLAAISFTGVIRAKAIFRITVNVLTGANSTFCVWHATNSDGTGYMAQVSFTAPDLTQPITFSMQGTATGFLSVKTYT